MKLSDDSLVLVQKELASQKIESERLKGQLASALAEIDFQNIEKGKRAAELGIANAELAFQNEERAKRAAEKEKRAAELSLANIELLFQNDEKEKRAAELIIANKELAYQNGEKEKRAAELLIANKELAFQNEEKEKRAAELIIANKELTAFTYISSHDLQEPLRKIQTFISMIRGNEQLSEKGDYNFQRIQLATGRMQQLIDDLLAFSHVSTTELKFEETDLSTIIEEVKADLKETIQEKQATIDTLGICSAKIIVFQFRQLMFNLLSNALKFSKAGQPCHIVIESSKTIGGKPDIEGLLHGKQYCHIAVRDNGIGFESQYRTRIFEVFQRLHGKELYEGTGIGLAIVKKIVENHHGIVTASSVLNEGSTFDIYLPSEQT